MRSGGYSGDFGDQAALRPAKPRRMLRAVDLETDPKLAALLAPRAPDPALFAPLTAEKVNFDFQRSDSGQAELIAALYADRLRFDHKRNRWLLWGGNFWREDVDGEVGRLALAAARLRFLAANTEEDLPTRRRWLSWAVSSESKSRLDSALALARSIKPLADSGENWDSDPWLLAVKNGVVDLRTGELRAGKPEDKITRHLDIDYNPDSADPEHPGYPHRWTRFLREIFSRPDGGIELDLLGFVQAAIGCTLSGITREQAFFLLTGAGSNGKSVLLAVLRHLLGPWAYAAPFSTFEAFNRSSIPCDLADLADRRLVTSEETSDGSRFAEGRLKALTGGGSMTARHLHQEFFSFEPTCKLWLCVNHLPKVNDDTFSFWRRCKVIRFQRRFDPALEPDLLDKLKAEASGILAVATKWCLAWQADGLGNPDAVRDASQSYEADSDPLAGWLSMVDLDPGADIKASAAWASYKTWTDKEELTEKERLTRHGWGRRMGGRFKRLHKTAGEFYLGLKMKI